MQAYVFPPTLPLIFRKDIPERFAKIMRVDKRIPD